MSSGTRVQIRIGRNLCRMTYLVQRERNRLYFSYDGLRDICNRLKVMNALFRALVSTPGLVGAYIESARAVSFGGIRGAGDRQVTCEATIVTVNGERIERTGTVTRDSAGAYNGQWAG